MEETIFQHGFAGRREEWEELGSYFQEAIDGEGSTVFISGEAGVGKTTLVEEFIDKIASKKAEIVKGTCLSDSLEPLMPVREALRDADAGYLISETPPPKVLSTYLIDESGLLVRKAEREESDLDSDIFVTMLSTVEDFVQDSLSMMGREKNSQLNTIGYGDYDIVIQTMDSFSLACVIEGTEDEFLIEDMRKNLVKANEILGSWDGNMRKAEEVAPLVDSFIDSDKYDGKFLVDDPEIKRENLFDNVLLGLKRRARKNPIVVFIDDLQWADPTSLNLLHYLSRNTKDERVLILGTYRPEDIVRRWDGTTHKLKTIKQDMSREGLYEEIRLERLEKSTVETFIEKKLGRIRLEKRFLDRVYQESEGNPFFLQEVVRMLIEEGHLSKKDGVWQMEGSLEELPIPSRVYDVVVRRLDRLKDEHRGILERASILGEEFQSDILQYLSSLERVQLLKELNDIERSYNLIHSSRNKYKFDHSKIRDVLYHGVNDELRREYHRVVAEGYKEACKDDIDEVLEQVAHHYFKAEDEKGVEYLLEAGDKAKEGYSNDEAERFYKHALSLIEDERSETAITAYNGLGEVFKVTGRYEEALEYFEKVLNDVGEDKKKAQMYGKMAEVFKEMGDYEEMLDNSEEGLTLTSEDDIERCRLLNNKGWALMQQGAFDKVADVFQKEASLADELGEDKEKAQALHDLGTVFWHKGDYEEGIDHLEQAIDLWKGMENKQGLAKSYNNLAVIYSDKGDLDESLDYQERCLDIHQEIGGKYGIATSLNNIGNIYMKKGELDRALDHQERCLEIHEEIGDKYGIATSLNNIGAVYRNKGDLDRSEEYHERSLELVEEIGHRYGLATSLYNLGVVFYYKGELDKAMEHYEKSIDIEEEIGNMLGVVRSLVGLVDVHLAKGELEDIEKKAQKALKIAGKIGAKGEKVGAHQAYGKIYREREEWDKAEEEFEKAFEILEESGGTVELAKTHYDYALTLRAKGEEGKTEEHLKKALSMFEEMGMKLWIEKTEEALSR